MNNVSRAISKNVRTSIWQSTGLSKLDDHACGPISSTRLSALSSSASLTPDTVT